MKSSTMTVVRRIYDYIECALWATLSAFVIYFLIFIAPDLPQIARRAEIIRASNIAAENASHCEKWGMKNGTHEHTLCKIDLQELRKKIKQELAEEGNIF